LDLLFVDLSFARLDRDVAVTAMPTALAVLLVGVAARQAASPTAQAQARLVTAVPADVLLAPAHGAFHRAAARALTRWQGR
jgi:hypothetical protein